MTAPAAKPDPVTQSRARVLVIDDDPLFRNLLSTLLRRDYLVMVASDGMDGFRRAKDHPPDIAIIDVQMPGWDGIQTLQEFRKHPTLRKVGTIMLTADATRDTVVTAIQHGANDYVIKSSFSREEFFSKLGKLVRKLRGLSETAPETAHSASAVGGSPSATVSTPQFALPKSAVATSAAGSGAVNSPDSSISDEEFFAPVSGSAPSIPTEMAPLPEVVAVAAAPVDRLRDMIDSWE